MWGYAFDGSLQHWIIRYAKRILKTFENTSKHYVVRSSEVFVHKKAYEEVHKMSVNQNGLAVEIKKTG